MFKKTTAVLRFVYNDVKARAVKYYRTKEVVKALELKHATELSEIPANLWAVTKRQHAQEIAAAASGKFPIVDRRTWSHPYLPESLHRLHQPLLKATPYNLRRFSETPIPRRAINLVKNAILSLPWEITPTEDHELNPDREQRIRIAKFNLNHPNNYDSFMTLMEAVLEDFLVGGYGCIEPAMTPYYKRPFKMWAVDGSTIRIFPDWDESDPDKPKYAQMTGLKGERGFVVFRADELFYVRDNVRTNTPFGLGRLEIVFNAVNAFLSAQDMATKAGGDQIHKTFLWFRQALSRGHFEQIRKYIRNEGEGQAKINMVSGIDKPDVLEANPVTEADLLLNWQEFLIRIIATGFDLSPQAVGLERDVNKSTSQVLDTKDFRSGVVPVASKFQEMITRLLLHTFMGWKDLQFKFIGLDDPDILVKMNILSQLYKTDSVTSNQIALKMGFPKIEGGWGDLTMGQKQIIQLKATALLGLKGTGGASGSGQGGFGQAAGGGSGMPMSGSIFSAQDVAEMSPQEIEQYQQQGMLPQDSQQLQDNMEENQPGILNQLSDELRDYFKHVKEEGAHDAVEPAKVTSADEKKQVKTYKKNDKARFPQSSDRSARRNGDTHIDRRFQ